MKRVRIVHDDMVPNPFTDWDCEPPLMWSSGRGRGEDYSDGDIREFIREKLTTEIVVKHEEAIFDLGWARFRDQDDDEFADAIKDELCSASIEDLAKVCNLIGISCKQYTSRGNSQGDWADVLIVLTDEFFERTGCEREHAEEILADTAKLFDQWMWGDTWMFIIEEGVEYVKMPKADFDKLNMENIEETIEWELVESCGGFFGSNVEENGMLGNIPEELHESARAAELEYN